MLNKDDGQTFNSDSKCVWKNVLQGVSGSPSADSGGGTNTQYSNKGNIDPLAPYWGYYGIRIAYDSSNYVSLFGLFSIDKMAIQEWSSPTRAKTNTYDYICPSGTSMVGLAYHFTDWKLDNPMGVQCMPRNCPSGQYSVDYGRSCSTCAIGKYSPGGYTVGCTQCTNAAPYDITFQDYNYAALTYTSSASSNACSYNCKAGYGGGSAGSPCSNACCKCNAGYFSASGAECIACPAGKFVSTTGASDCISCESGKTFQPNPGSIICLSCESIVVPKGYYQVACTVTSNTKNVVCPSCTGGKYLSPSCGAYQQPMCVDCVAGKIQPTNIPEKWEGAEYVCTLCGAGTYQTGVGMSRCTNCINPQPVNGAYSEWAVPSTSGSNCPSKCNAGFGYNGSQCILCVPGQYSPGALVPAACLSCTPGLSSNAYWLQPVQFNRSWDGCPRDCKAGFSLDTKTNNCVPCVNGKTYSEITRTTDKESSNACSNCSVCSEGQYSSMVCNASRNTRCSPCRSNCLPGSYIKQCNSTHASTCLPCKTSCAPGQYMTDLCTGNTIQDIVQCASCRTPSACTTGLYMPPNQCPGNTARNSECVVCQSLPCPFGTYQRACSMYNDTSCVEYTQCVPGRTTLRNRGLTNDGVCQNCTNCSAYGRGTAANCSQYRDTLCNGTACSGESPCVNSADQNFFCNMDAFGAARASRTTQGVCGLCPDGYSSDRLFCYECPGGKTCSRDGAVRCQGQVRLGLEPWCYGEYAQPTGDACPYSADSTRVVTRSTFLRPNGNCAPYFRCAPGYFKHFASTGLVTCDACESNVIPVNFAWFSDGLSINDPFSCMYECAARSSWPSGACSLVNTTTYIPNNPTGFYDDRSGAMKPCPIGSTSPAGLATSVADCARCHAPGNTLGDPCQAWTCPSGGQQRGGLCFDPGDCPSQMIGYTRVLGACVATALPWQPPGYQKPQAATPGAPAEVLVARVESGVAQDDMVSAAVQDASNRTLVFYSTPYGRSKRHWLAVNATTSVDLPGRVCSAAAIVCQARQYVVVAFCNASFLSFLDLSLASPSPRVLIGASAAGYREGFKADARFEQVLHVASEAGRSSLFVADTMNCALRAVSIPTLPGDFVVRSYLVYGYTAAICSTAPTAILYPGRLFPLLGQTYFLFPATNGLYQLDAGTRSVVQVVPSSRRPPWVPDWSLLLSVTLAANASALTLGFANTTAVLTPIQQRCDVGFTSVLGGACTVSCSTSTNYVDPASGECKLCFFRNCLPGEEDVPCTSTSPQTCKACPLLEPEQGRYPRIYNLPGSCALSNTLYTAPCPLGFYLSTTLVRGALICASCPRFSNTTTDGSTSIDQCRCYEGTMKGTGGQCVVKQLYPLPTLSKCPFGTYPRGAFERCSSCRLDPFPLCDFGRYPLSNGSCEACQVPENAVPARAGRAVNAPRSCGFACLPGYSPLSNMSYLTQCQPCTNAPNVNGSGAEFFPITNGQQDSPGGCTWGCKSPFKISNGECVPCTLLNPVNASLPCKHPWLSVNSSAGNGTNATLNGITYRLIRFNQSGSIKFSTTVLVDVLVVGGGGAGGGAFLQNGAGGGGGAGQVLLSYGCTAIAKAVMTVVIGKGGIGQQGPGGRAATSSSINNLIPAGNSAFFGANGGPSGFPGFSGASSGGSGSFPIRSVSTAATGFVGGGDTTGGFMGAGGGGSTARGGDSLACQGGNGGAGTTLLSSNQATLFDLSPALLIGGGGGGGSGIPGCPGGLPGQGAGAGSDGGDANGSDAAPNSGAGGGGASSASGNSSFAGGNGGSGLVILRYIDDQCVCT